MSKLHKQQFKRLKRAIAWLLVLTLVANILNAFVAPEKAKAVDVNDHMLLFWPTANGCADAPTGSGWTAVSDGVGEPFKNIFPRGAATYVANNGSMGSATHTHAVTSVTTTGVVGTNLRKTTTGTYVALNTHTHTGNSASVTASGSEPKYKELCVIQYTNGIPNGDAAIPNGAVAIFDTNPGGISGWGDYSATFSAGADTFIRGGAAATGGSNTHANPGHTVTPTLGASSGQVYLYAGASNAATTGHTHPNNPSVNTTDTPDIQPPYMDIYLGQKSSAGPIPNGMIAMFDDADGSVGFSVAGWTRLSDGGGPFNNRFLKVTGTYNNPSGAAQHTQHPTLNSNSANGSGGIGAGTTAQTTISETHYHTLQTLLAQGTNTNIPQYTDVVIAKKQTVITVLNTNGVVNFPNHGDIITVNATVNNYHATDALNNKKLDYVIFRDTVTANGRPDGDGAGPNPDEKYITDGCAGWAAWNSALYTHQSTISVAAGASTADIPWDCANTFFPDSDTYTLWAQWWDGTSYSYNIYYQKGSVTFTSVPTLSEILFMALVGCAVFLGVRTGVIKIRKNGKTEPLEPPLPPAPKDLSNINRISDINHQIGRPFDCRSGFRKSTSSRSIDGVSRSEIRKQL